MKTSIYCTDNVLYCPLDIHQSFSMFQISFQLSYSKFNLNRIIYHNTSQKGYDFTNSSVVSFQWSLILCTLL